MQKEKRDEASEILLELDFVKRELYELIMQNHNLMEERNKARSELNELQS